MKPKILVVNLNFAVAKTAAVDGFKKGSIYRLSEVRTMPGGKGVNVARVLRGLGLTPSLAGFVAGRNGRLIEAALRREGFDAACVPFSPGESRMCLSVVDSRDGVSTDFNEEGSPVPPAAQKRFLAVYERCLKGCSFVAFSGRMSPGLGDDFFARLIAIARRRRIVTALDTNGAPLRPAVNAGPSLIKLNREEFEYASGESLTPRSVVRFFRRVLASGTEYVVITDGPAYAWAVTPQNLWRFSPPKLKLVSAVGAGDSFMAGLIYGFATGRNRQQCARLALGAAASDCLSLGAGVIDRRQCFAMAAKAGLKRLPLGD